MPLNLRVGRTKNHVLADRYSSSHTASSTKQSTKDKGVHSNPHPVGGSPVARYRFVQNEKILVTRVTLKENGINNQQLDASTTYTITLLFHGTLSTMVKRAKTPEAADDEKYFTVYQPYPLNANWELPTDYITFCRWISSCIGTQPLYALHYKPRVRHKLSFLC